MSFEAVLYQVDGAVCTVTLNRPEKMNTWTPRLATDLSAALRKANDDDAVRAVVITGAGRAFCAGADLERGGDAFAGRDGDDRPQADMPTVYPNQIDKPVIAAINGPAVGVGMTYPMLCDIRLAADTAKMGFVFTRRGMMPELAAHLIVQRVAGFSNAADLLMSGRIFTAEEAARLGLVSRVLPRRVACSRDRDGPRLREHGARVSRAHETSALERSRLVARADDAGGASPVRVARQSGRRAGRHHVVPGEARTGVDGLAAGHSGRFPLTRQIPAYHSYPRSSQ